ncbi:MAG: hypothetical protein B6U72_07410 [Candidatus Altiarchaeales archaeon ex4484_2]|nr:MAG: hypothetical protein B6U72_07410 [Candidatus Altiarchaeales archaeon ex4484_2]
MSLARLYYLTGDERYLKAIFILNDELVKMQNKDGYPYIDYLGRFYDPTHPEYGVPFSGSTSVYLEGLIYAYEVAQLVNDTEHQEEYREAIILKKSLNIVFRYL